MSMIVLILLICLVVGRVLYFLYVEIKERELIIQVTSPTRGERSERQVIVQLLKAGINPKAIFHDLYLKKAKGGYTQIDLAVATKAGIIVFEVKDYSGWIFGNEHQKYWTQVLAYGREKHRFYNPILQNQGHIKALRQKLHFNPDIPIYSVIVFYGSSNLKSITFYSDNTFIIYPASIQNVLSSILCQPEANFGNKHEIMEIMTEAVRNGNDPNIVASQIQAAKYYGRNRPQSTYSLSLCSLFREIVFYKGRKFW